MMIKEGIVIDSCYGYHGANCCIVHVVNAEESNFYDLYNDYGEHMTTLYSFSNVYDFIKRLEAGQSA